MRIRCSKAFCLLTMTDSQRHLLDLKFTPFPFFVKSIGLNFFLLPADDLEEADSLRSYQLMTVAAQVVDARLLLSSTPQPDASPRKQRKFCVFPVFFDRVDQRNLPRSLAASSCYCVNQPLSLNGDGTRPNGLMQLYACLTGQLRWLSFLFGQRFNGTLSRICSAMVSLSSFLSFFS